jgi:hypothetical protein
MTKQPNALTHGAYARSKPALEVRARRVGRLVRRMRVAMPWLQDSDIPTCKGWAELEILGATIFAALMTGLSNDKGEPRALIDKHRSIRAVQLQYARELGMTPAARKALIDRGKGGFDLVGALAENADEEVIPADDRPEGTDHHDPD